MRITFKQLKQLTEANGYVLVVNPYRAPTGQMRAMTFALQVTSDGDGLTNVTDLQKVHDIIHEMNMGIDKPDARVAAVMLPRFKQEGGGSQ